MVAKGQFIWSRMHLTGFLMWFVGTVASLINLLLWMVVLACTSNHCQWLKYVHSSFQLFEYCVHVCQRQIHVHECASFSPQLETLIKNYYMYKKLHSILIFYFINININILVNIYPICLTLMQFFLLNSCNLKSKIGGMGQTGV